MAHRRAGSILIMVVVVLVLMVVIGAAYIQSARWDRIATHLIVTNNIDTVAAATIAQIQSALQKDLIDSTGNCLDETTKHEPFDYPSTGAAVATINTFPNYATAHGGDDDDTWLACTAPDFTTPANPTWLHVTNLNGVFLDVPASAGTATVPLEYVVDESTNNNSDASLSILNDLETANAQYVNRGVDADGDGVEDSRWTWAPIRQIGGVTYVMAVRIVDNSSMANANVWMSQITTAGTYDTTAAGTDAPHWNYPTELDLGGFVNSISTIATSTELPALLTYRLGGVATTMTATTPSTAIERNNFWLLAARIYGKYTAPYQALTIQDELRMRLSNGLSNMKPSGQLETQMPTFLRTTGTPETIYYNFNGGAAGAAEMQAFFESEPRHQMTVRSGAAIFAPRMAGATGDTTPRVLKVDLNKTTAAAAITGLNATAISTTIKQVVSQGAFDFTAYPGTTDAQGFADQLTACIIDYKDRDNLFTKVGNHYGMEQVPIITEVYVQGRYKATSATPAGGPFDTVVWTLEGNAGYAIEIRNPFRVTISLQNIHLRVEGVDWGALDTLSGGQTTLGANKAIVFYQNSNGNTDTANDDVGALITTANQTKVAINKTWPNNAFTAAAPIPTTATISVELRGTDGTDPSSPVLMTFAYDQVDSDGMPTAYTQTAVSLGTDPTTTPYEGYEVRGHIGNSNGLNMLATSGTGGSGGTFTKIQQDIDASATAPTPLRDATKNDLNVDDKTAPTVGHPTGPANLTTVGPPAAVLANQQLLFKQSTDLDDNITQVGELAQIAIIGPDSTKTVPEKWASLGANAGDVRNLMLNFTSTNYVGAGNQAIPHAALLLDRFTTVSPAVDGVDNDNQNGVDDSGEQFVPGTINLNTVTEKFLEKVLPIPDTTPITVGGVRQKVATAIIAYRDCTNDVLNGHDYSAANRGFGAGYRTTKGIASIGELMNCLSPIFGADTVDNTTLNGTLIDFTPVAGTPDGVTDDREEEAMIMRWLTQTCTVRSDIYTAYVLIEGFPSGDFRKGAVEATRFFVVFDRSGITDNSKPVKILGIYKVN